MKAIFIYSTVFALFFALTPIVAKADAWWGEGYRTPQWVIAHGGTIINYSSNGAKGAVEVKLYTSDKRIIEKEEGSSGVFDDALPGQAYFLRAKSGSKKIRSADFVLKKGSVNNVVVDFSEKSISIN